MKRLRAPRENHAILAEPPLREVGPLLAQNRQRFQQDLRFLGVPWSELRFQAAQSARAAAEAYLQEAGEPLPALSDGPLLLAGHQPELFHPGVWIKNFALCRLAREHGAVPLNLIIDSDTARSTQSARLLLPEGNFEHAAQASGHLASVPIDRWQAGVPYEEYRVDNETFFAQLPERTAPVTRSWPFVPMLANFWQDVVKQGERTSLLGERLVSARRTWERRWGCHNFEVPLSKLCQTEPFVRFACHLLQDLPRFHAIYNQAVQAYRRQHGIRSRNHPVPDLATSGDWLEAPFWIWVQGQHRRERLFARLSPAGLHLRCGNDIELSLPRPDAAPEQAVARWLALEPQGIKIRTRALTTTMYARLLVGDAFLHGIGGGTYDELTDVLMRQFHGIEPPGYLVVSATLLLPFPRSSLTGGDVRRLAAQQRDSWWNPERHYADQTIRELAKEKQAWIARAAATPAQRRTRFERLREIVAKMRLVQADYDRQKETLSRAKHDLAVNQILGRRDFAFCLFPEEELREFLSSPLAV